MWLPTHQHVHSASERTRPWLCWETASQTRECQCALVVAADVAGVLLTGVPKVPGSPLLVPGSEVLLGILVVSVGVCHLLGSPSLPCILSKSSVSTEETQISS